MDLHFRSRDLFQFSWILGTQLYCFSCSCKRSYRGCYIRTRLSPTTPMYCWLWTTPITILRKKLSNTIGHVHCYANHNKTHTSNCSFKADCYRSSLVRTGNSSSCPWLCKSWRNVATRKSVVSSENGLKHHRRKSNSYSWQSHHSKTHQPN